jgi:hypothetical protein
MTDQEQQQPLASPDTTDYLLGIHDFKARSEDEISVRKGDRIEVIENDHGYGDGWYIVCICESMVYGRILVSQGELP